MSETDRAAKAAERIAKHCRDRQRFGGIGILIQGPELEAIASIIRAEYPSETVMQARAENLESVLAKVREECERSARRSEMMHAGDILAILNESGEAAGGSE